MARWPITLMSPREALMWLVPGAIAFVVTWILYQAGAASFLVMTIAVAGFLPSAWVVAWGHFKFRSFYEVKRTRADLWTMFHATVIPLIALGLCMGLSILALESPHR